MSERFEFGESADSLDGNHDHTDDEYIEGDQMESQMKRIDDGLDRIIQKTEETIATGTETTAQLYAQGEALRRALDELDEQQTSLDHADFQLQKLEQGFCWQLFCCCCCCCEPKPPDRHDYKGVDSKDSADPFEEPLIQAIGMSSSKASRCEWKDENEDEEQLTMEEQFDRTMDDKLDKIGGALDKLGRIAGDMGSELDYHGRVLIPELDARVQDSRDRTRDLDKRTRKLL
mmetsp:Transcript_8566/g.15836  ORF Transcript_8566/g.15836 Transcript_8566/m.15836 type:complete len:231 (-) Transcript_8566:314-1006(-)